jgi:hypothetical protein
VIAAAAAAALGFYAGAVAGHALIGPGARFYDLTAFAIAGLCGAGAYVLTVLGMRRSLPFRELL